MPEVVKLEDRIIDPLRPGEFGLSDHRFQRHDANIAPGVTIDQLESPKFWVNVASRIRPGDEVRAVSEDFSLVVTLICTYRNGSDCRMRVISGTVLRDANTDVSMDDDGDLEVVLLGKKRFVVRNKHTGEIKKENIATKAEAYKELEQFNKILNS
jgi:hypothetical protein